MYKYHTGSLCLYGHSVAVTLLANRFDFWSSFTVLFRSPSNLIEFTFILPNYDAPLSFISCSSRSTIENMPFPSEGWSSVHVMLTGMYTTWTYYEIALGLAALFNWRWVATHVETTHARLAMVKRLPAHTMFVDPANRGLLFCLFCCTQNRNEDVLGLSHHRVLRVKSPPRQAHSFIHP